MTYAERWRQLKTSLWKKCERYVALLWREFEYTLGALARKDNNEAPDRIELSDFNIIFTTDN